MKIRSLVLKIVISMIMIDIISISIVTVLYYLQSKDALYNRAFIQLAQVKRIKSDQIRNLMKDALSSAYTLADDLKFPNNSFDSSKLSQIITVAPFDNISIYDKFKDSLNLLYRNQSTNYHIEQLEYLLKICTSNSSITELPDYNRHFSELYITEKIDSNRTLIINIDKDKINKLLSHSDRDSLIDKSIESYLVGADGFLRSPSKFFKNAEMRLKYSEVGMGEIDLSLYSQNNIHSDYRAEKVLRVAEKLNFGDVNWILLVEIDENEVNAPFARMWRNTLFVIFIINMGISLVAYFFAKKLTTPIINLTNASIKMYGGVYPTPVDSNSFDEIGTLTNNFNQMIQKIRTQADELEIERNKRLNAYITATEVERKRISSELHDGLGQSLIALKLQLECLEPDRIDRNDKILTGAKNLLDDSIDELRNMSNDLLPNVLSELGLLEGIKQIVNYCSNKADLNFTLQNNMLSVYQINEKESVHIYRIIQEAVKNAITHSYARNIEIILDETNEWYKFIIKDDGKGFEPQNKKLYGNGLYNINERANLINAELMISSDSSRGSTIEIRKRK